MCILFETAIPLPVIYLKEITMDGKEFASKIFLTILLGVITNSNDKFFKHTTVEFGSIKPYYRILSKIITMMS